MDSLELQRHFEISRPIFWSAMIFVLLGLGLGTFTDYQEGQWFLVSNDLVVLVLVILLLVLGALGKIPRGRALGLTMITGLYLFYIEIFPPYYAHEFRVNLFLFNSIMIVAYAVLGGFLLGANVTLGIGATSLVFMGLAWYLIGGDFLEEHMPLLLVVVLAITALVFGYRRKLELIVKELIAQRSAAEEALQKLKVAQRQIITQEKLASLGALTAGIAHEIKNPLNFINNFAESSVDLMKEMQAEIDPHLDKLPEEARKEVDYFLAELKTNMDDISHNGKRANGIVTSMLAHSRLGSSEKLATDPNKVIEEAWGLAYHGYRARENGFKAEVEMRLANDLGQVPMVAHEISRVLLNLISNGLYAAARGSQALPRILIESRKLRLENGEFLEITIMDNGPGISEEHRERIFTPFFTTKPTGEGTGLGLSISHDIVSAGHGGSMSVESPGGALFRIRIPYQAREGGSNLLAPPS